MQSGHGGLRTMAIPASSVAINPTRIPINAIRVSSVAGDQMGLPSLTTNTPTGLDTGMTVAPSGVS